MGQIITATFEDGLFKPDHPPALDPNSRVRLIVEPIEGPKVGEEGEERRRRRDEIDRRWNDPARVSEVEDLDQLLDEISFVSGEPRPTRDELHDRH